MIAVRNASSLTIQAYKLALLELGRAADTPSVRNLLKSIIRGVAARGGVDSKAVAHAAVDEIVLSTGGEVRPTSLC